eukprot:1476147-Amphidinium_carterae.1
MVRHIWGTMQKQCAHWADAVCRRCKDDSLRSTQEMLRDADTDAFIAACRAVSMHYRAAQDIQIIRRMTCPDILRAGLSFLRTTNFQPCLQFGWAAWQKG